MINIKKELIIFLTLFIVSSLIVHNTVWVSKPIEHLTALSSHPMPYHPLLYVFLIYIIVVFFRVVTALVKKLFSKK